MSKGLGKVERIILQALESNSHDGNKAYKDGVSVNELSYYVGHGLDCFQGSFCDRPAKAVYQATARAVRSLTGKGLVKCQHSPAGEYRGDGVQGGRSWIKGVKLSV